jgi:hypothetical protein
LYGLHYGDGSSTVGFFAQDNLTISHDAIEGYRFRCGEKNSGRNNGARPREDVADGAGLGQIRHTAARSRTPSRRRHRGRRATWTWAAANARLTPMLTDDIVLTFVLLGTWA